MSIGVVLERLQEEFPDVTVSKIRYLEQEGLVHPQRTSSGYRRFTDADVDRLRYVLTTQRDNYTPLKVIREQLEAMDSAQVTALVGAGNTDTIVAPENFRATRMTRMADTDMAEAAKCSVADIAQLASIGMIKPDAGGFYCADDVRTVSAALALREFGLDSRQLKRLVTTAVRDADVLSQIVLPMTRAGDDTARERAGEIASQMSALAVTLHAGLVKAALRDSLDS